jgi:hypothetical protein
MLSGILKSFEKEELKILQKENKTKIININTKIISKFLEENKIKKIDYLTLDIEGKEEEILKNIDFTKTFIDIISVEDNNNLKKVDKILIKNNFRLLKHNYLIRFL